MTRNRVLSFMSQFSNRDSQKSPTGKSMSPTAQIYPQAIAKDEHPVESRAPSRQDYPSSGDYGHQRTPSGRPLSMLQSYQPTLMDVDQDTPAELQPIFTFLNSHTNKLYQEGYFLKLDDQNTDGKANIDRTWTECYAQLVGTVLSLWDAAELDAAGQEGEVLPKFINLTDASIKIFDSLPIRSENEAPLQNVLSISTAGKNRYLLHFNSHHSLVQWTAGIRLAMFEHATLQEAYTGALIAGKGKGLNNIKVIMERTRLKTEDWVRVRFGAGTPWRRCWCVLNPPDEKEVQKVQKQASKKKSAYDRSRPPVLKGTVQFFDAKRTKKSQPIFTITDAYSAFAIYPQSKPLIDASTLIKLEGSITIHSNPPSSAEGFVFVMPEVHPAVTGFEMMLRWLFPVFDIFGLYGRPGRLIADTTNQESLMFAMPKHRRYGYLETLDVSGLISEDGSTTWNESDWRRKMKELTNKRMTALESGSQPNSRYNSRRSTRNSFGPSHARLRFNDDNASVRSQPSIAWALPPNASAQQETGIPRTDSAPPATAVFAQERPASSRSRQRSASESHSYEPYAPQIPTAYDEVSDQPPPPPVHQFSPTAVREGSGLRYMAEPNVSGRGSPDDEQPARSTPVRELEELQTTTSPEPVAPPPAFSHAPGSKPLAKPYHSPELRRANSRMSNSTLSQMAGAGGLAAAAGMAQYAAERTPRTSEDNRRQDSSSLPEDRSQIGVPSNVNSERSYANQDGVHEGLVTQSTPAPMTRQFSFEPPTNRSPNIEGNSSNSQALPRIAIANAYASNSQPNLSQNISTFQGATDSSLKPSVSTSEVETTRPRPSSVNLDTSSFQGPENSNRNSISRKPLPKRTESIQSPASAHTTSSTDSFAQNFIDQNAFDLIGMQGSSRSTPAPGAIGVTRSGTTHTAGSVYSDDSTIDYASTVKSSDSRPSVEKPRTGVMRTVGNPTSVGQNDSVRASIPDIDFGPTINYASDRRSSAHLQQIATGRTSPGPSAFVTGQNNSGATNRPRSSGKSKSPAGRRNLTPEPAGHLRNESSESRSIPWSPGMGAVQIPNHGLQHGMSAEQFVQKRAAAPPMYAHQRVPSGNVLRSNTPTPPLGRNRSSEMLTQLVHSRNNSTDLLQQRPGSRGASTVLGANGDYNPTLSAREQERIARATGQPLINMAGSNRLSQGAGLVGAIDAREREKAQMKQGINSQAVQMAIAQRQQQSMYQQYPNQQSAAPIPPMHGYAPSQFQGQMPQQQQQQQQQQQRNSWVAPSGYAPSQMGWSNQPPAYANPEQGRQTPQQHYYQYPPGQGQQGGQGRGQGGYY